MLGPGAPAPPLALDRLKLLGDDLACIELKRAWRDHPRLHEPEHLPRAPRLARAAPASPRVGIGRSEADASPRSRPIPRRATSGAKRRGVNTTLCYGVLAARSRDRASITPKPTTTRVHDASWAALMRHSFGLDLRSCPRCKGRLRFVAVVFDPVELERLLAYLHCFSDPLPLHPARAPPVHDESFDFP